ncbi:hypothetical protein Pmani_034557 [Petrolisthes manimaculis]|uniref:Uncharacterized protein n=1 Tax=Petrolisthes manimaculis TaxID=1843537 RepID=A0AAE1NNG7_9EUCA|nr:hypothetical protein Pmani_034557 [Petrolisthes manimaculis]
MRMDYRENTLRPHAEPHVLGCCGIMQPLHPGIIASDGRRHKNHLIGVGGRRKTPGINTSVGRLGDQMRRVWSKFFTIDVQEGQGGFGLGQKEEEGHVKKYRPIQQTQ